MPRPLRQAVGTLTIATRPQSFTNITGQVTEWLQREGIAEGLLTLFVQHTSASLVIQENADPDVLLDLADGLERLAPMTASYRHDAEGPDDMPAHLKASVTGQGAAIPIIAGRLALGTWQGLYLAEHRTSPHRRKVALHVLGA